MTIPQLPPDEPGTEIPPEEPIPEDTPEYPGSQEPEWRAPGAVDQPDTPMRAPSETPDAETGL